MPLYYMDSIFILDSILDPLSYSIIDAGMDFTAGLKNKSEESVAFSSLNLFRR